MIHDALRLEELKDDVVTIHSTLTLIEDGVQKLVDIGWLSGLNRAPLAGYNIDTVQSKRPEPLQGCLEGTRTNLLEDIHDWVKAKDTRTPFIYWLNGMAGTGKSTIARSVASMAHEDGVLGATFFCSKYGDATLSDSSLILPTIAYQLAQFDKSQEFRSRIAAAISDNSQLLDPIPRDQQFMGLIGGPLRQAVGHRGHVVLIVLDALDQCDSRGIEAILRALVTEAQADPFPFHLKFFITSRPEAHITPILDSSHELTVVYLHNIESSVVGADIRLFLQYHSVAIWRKFGAERGLPVDWMSQADLDELTRLCGKLFIFAATAVRVIGDEYERDPQSQLQNILQSSQTFGVPSFGDIDELYAKILKNCIPSSFRSDSDAQRFFTRFRDVVAMVILLQEPLSITAMDRFAGRRQGDVRAALQHVHSVIFTPSSDAPPQVYHPSFPDFISSEERCLQAGVDKRFAISVGGYQVQLALWSLNLLGSILTKRILGDLDPQTPNKEIKKLDAQLTRILGAEGRYAMRQWASHLSQASCDNYELVEAFEHFISRKGLWWLEAMSLLGDTHGADDALCNARDWAVRTMMHLPPVSS